ncbi:hypothetical protein A5630_20725 [Mycolicibacterium mucogenicum]|uniref:Uncharacterized protein n=1 Tax=Mycolicibacterium mucogenicum TaxID=56689 RepID=A0A1A3H4H9_MYCMU|nr:hypothetical protein A5630_20725 [Mycolicibacterium mucogenicum]
MGVSVDCGAAAVAVLVDEAGVVLGAELVELCEQPCQKAKMIMPSTTTPPRCPSVSLLTRRSVAPHDHTGSSIQPTGSFSGDRFFRMNF